MGIWETISSSTEAIAGGAAAKGRDASWNAASWTIQAVKTISSSTGAIAGGAAAKGLDSTWSAASWTIQAVTERASDREGWEKIGRLGCKVVDHALADLTRPYTAGIPVYRYVREEYFGNNNLKNQQVKGKNKNLELQEALKRLDSLEKELMDIKQENSDQIAQIKNQNFPKFVNWKPIEWNFEIE